MAEIILAVLCIAAGLFCWGCSLLVLWANAMGGVTNASAVDNAPAFWIALVGLVGVVGGISILVF